jgi:hypothetical protein
MSYLFENPTNAGLTSGLLYFFAAFLINFDMLFENEASKTTMIFSVRHIILFELFHLFSCFSFYSGFDAEQDSW